MWIEKYQYFLYTDDKMRRGWWGGNPNKFAHLQHIDFHVLKNVHRLECNAGTSTHPQ